MNVQELYEFLGELIQAGEGDLPVYLSEGDERNQLLEPQIELQNEERVLVL